MISTKFKKEITSKFYVWRYRVHMNSSVFTNFLVYRFHKSDSFVSEFVLDTEVKQHKKKITRTTPANVSPFCQKRYEHGEIRALVLKPVRNQRRRACRTSCKNL